MFLFTPQSARWRRRALAALAIATAVYVAHVATGFPHGGSPVGLTFGVLSLALILVLLFYGARKRWHRFPAGRLETWCQSHVYLGLLVVALLLFHAGFRFEDPVAVAALVVVLAVVASGVVGVILYTTAPALLTAVEHDLAPEAIASQLEQLAKAMARVATGKSPAFVAVWRKAARRVRPSRATGWRLLVGGPRQRDGWDRRLDEAMADVPPAERADLQQLFVLGRQHLELRRNLALQMRYRVLLKAWLFVHLPLSLGLGVLVVAHLAGVLYYSRLGAWLFAAP